MIITITITIVMIMMLLEEQAREGERESRKADSSPGGSHGGGTFIQVNDHNLVDDYEVDDDDDEVDDGDGDESS